MECDKNAMSLSSIVPSHAIKVLGGRLFPVFANPAVMVPVAGPLIKDNCPCQASRSYIQRSQSASTPGKPQEVDISDSLIIHPV